MITNKHRTYVPRPTDGGGNPVGVIYTTDEEELLDSERSAHERSLSGTRVNVSVITDKASRYYQTPERALKCTCVGVRRGHLICILCRRRLLT